MNKGLLALLGLVGLGAACCAKKGHWRQCCSKKTADNDSTQVSAKTVSQKDATHTNFAQLAVTPFDLKRYMGTWYEVARFDFFWEKNLKNVTAIYTLEEDGSVEVDNQGFDTFKNKDKQSTGSAKPTANADTGSLQVSFFGPFYSGYHVVKIDPEYRHALVFGDDTDYLWLLSREPSMPDDVKQTYLEFARQHGFDLNRLVWTQQDSEEELIPIQASKPPQIGRAHV